MSSARAAGARSPGKTIVMVVLVIIAVLAIIAAVMYFIEPAKSLPSVLGTITSPASRANATRPLRGAGSLIVAVLSLAGAWLVSRSGSASQG